jgi:hypothetical protein
MGRITVTVEGSFGDYGTKEFSAEEGGHAYALTRAIGFLFVVMSKAIRLDHDLHEKGTHPPRSAFGTKPK